MHLSHRFPPPTADTPITFANSSCRWRASRVPWGKYQIHCLLVRGGRSIKFRFSSEGGLEGKKVFVQFLHCCCSMAATQSASNRCARSFWRSSSFLCVSFSSTFLCTSSSSARLLSSSSSLLFSAALVSFLTFRSARCCSSSSWSLASASSLYFTSSCSYLLLSESDIVPELRVLYDDIVVKDQERKFHRADF